MIEEGMYHPKTKKKKKIHPQRERRYRRGELVQVDGSYHVYQRLQILPLVFLIICTNRLLLLLSTPMLDQVAVTLLLPAPYTT